MIKSWKKYLHRVRDWLVSPFIPIFQAQHDLILRAEWARSMTEAKNPLNRFGAKYFSQADEDGITLEIVRRLGLSTGTFAELGVGDGLENNTLILLAKGWRGFWIGGQDLRFDHGLNPEGFAFFKVWVSLENISEFMRQGLEKLSISEIDVLSLDLDGNDYYFAKEILRGGVLPKLFIVEYNGKFPPPIKWSIKYDAWHSWQGTDYYGASLASFAELLREFSYTLICCNAATGANAYFVRNEYLRHFADVPSDIDNIFVGCRYQLPQRFGHTPSPKTIERMLQTNCSAQSNLSAPQWADPIPDQVVAWHQVEPKNRKSAQGTTNSNGGAPLSGSSRGRGPTSGAHP